NRRARQEAGFDARLAANEGDQAFAALAGERAGIKAEVSATERACGGANCREAQVHQFHRLAIGVVAKGLAVEPLEGCMERRSVIPSGRHRHSELRRLTEVTHV